VPEERPEAYDSAVSRALPARFCAPGFEAALGAAVASAKAVFDAEGRARDVGGFTTVKARPMRAVLRGLLPGPGGPVPCYLKVHRADTALDRTRRRLSPPRGAAEGSVLLDLRKRGVPAPEPLAWASPAAGAPDLLVTRAVEDAEPFARARERASTRFARAALAEAVGRLLRRAHDAGFAGDDVHEGNLLSTPAGLVLLDPGGTPLRDAVPPARRIRLLGAAAHALGADARTGLRALRAYAGGDRERARRWVRDVSRDAASAARAFRARRARRATRTGLHFETFEPAGPGSRGVLSRRRATEEARDAAGALLAGAPPGARPLKADGSVVAARIPGVALGEEVVLKRYAARWKDPWRTPRAIRAFRRAYALRVRGVACPEPLLAVSGPDGAGVVASASAGPGATDLHEAARGRGPRLDPAERRRALRHLGRFLRRLHDAEVSHRDLKAPNLVVSPGPDGRARFQVVDLEGARLLRGPVPWRRRARDLARLDASVGPPGVSRADRLRVLRGYLRGAWARPPVEEAVFRAWAARDRAKKVGRSGAPR
jgi:tRNA A-37 threonylcarbamoyl transferase component Bud32